MFDYYDTLITPEEVADMLNCGMNTTYKLLKTGKIKAMRMNDNQFVGCKPFGFPFWYMRNPLAVHQFMEFNHKRQFKHRKDLAKHRVISFSKEEN